MKEIETKKHLLSNDTESKILGDIRQLINEAKSTVATTINASLTTLYWKIGRTINETIIKDERGDYGKRLMETLSSSLTQDYGSGFSSKNLHHMSRFAEVFKDDQIVSALRRQLSWTHLKSIIYIEEPLKREFYIEMCRVEQWSTRTLQKKIDSMLYERTALSKQPKALIKEELKLLKEEDKMTPELVFRDPYFLDFLGLKGMFHEKDLESAILREIESFLLEFGSGFSFVARQKRIQIDNDDFYIDLLFFHRNLRRLIAIELKIGEFKAEYKGQMELYLRWLDKYEKQPNENEPLGIILCTGKKHEQIELLELNKTGIHVAEYLTTLPPQEELKKKIHSAFSQSIERLENIP